MSIEKDVSVIRDYVENSYGDEDGRGKALEAIERLAYIKQAVLNEREACARWYAEKGWLLDEDDVANVMRKRDAL